MTYQVYPTIYLDDWGMVYYWLCYPHCSMSNNKKIMVNGCLWKRSSNNQQIEEVIQTMSSRNCPMSSWNGLVWILMEYKQLSVEMRNKWFHFYWISLFRMSIRPDGHISDTQLLQYTECSLQSRSRPLRWCKQFWRFDPLVIYHRKMGKIIGKPSENHRKMMIYPLVLQRSHGKCWCWTSKGYR